MDRLILSRNRKTTVDFGKGTIIQNDTHTKYEEIKVTEVDDDKATATIIGGNRARMDGMLTVSQSYKDILTVPCWNIFDEYIPADYVEGTPPPTQIVLAPHTTQQFYFEDVIYGVHYTNRMYETFFISRTGKEGSWFRIDGKDTIIIKGMVHFKVDDNNRNIVISLSDSINTADRVHTIMDFTAKYGAGSSTSGTPITALTYDPDTAILTGSGDGEDVIVDLEELRDGEGELLFASNIGENLTLEEFKAVVAALPKAGNYTYNNSDDPDKLIDYVALRSARDTVAFEANGMRVETINSSDL